ncbi:MAG: hypothetical protein EU535_04980 [Promethearchaeota archaeon]|nr:MAG: hypothetical protein EU535_04980 [Candidatus Lokiarchaeota archaeon]
MVNLKIENLKTWKTIACVITLAGGFQFILLTFIAMFFYPDGYSFTGDYFSYLGTTVNLKTGSPNTISRILFFTACVIVGASLIPFWLVISTVFTETNLLKYIGISGSITGIISSICLMGVGIFAEDTHYVIHTSLAKMFFSFIIIAILIYSFAILLNSAYHNIYSLIGIAFSISVILMLYIFRNSMLMNIIMQKVIVYGYCAWVTLHIFEILKKIGITFNYKKSIGNSIKKIFVRFKEFVL